MRNTIKLSNNAEKFLPGGKKQVWRITSREKGSPKETIFYDGLDVNGLKSWKCSIQPIPNNKTAKNFDAVPLLSIFSKKVT